MRFFSDTGTAPDEYDRVFTGDLGQVGSDLLHRLLLREGCDLQTIPAIAHLVNFRAE